MLKICNRRRGKGFRGLGASRAAPRGLEGVRLVRCFRVNRHSLPPSIPACPHRTKRWERRIGCCRGCRPLTPTGPGVRQRAPGQCLRAHSTCPRLEPSLKAWFAPPWTRLLRIGFAATCMRCSREGWAYSASSRDIRRKTFSRVSLGKPVAAASRASSSGVRFMRTRPRSGSALVLERQASNEPAACPVHVGSAPGTWGAKVPVPAGAPGAGPPP